MFQKIYALGQLTVASGKGLNISAVCLVFQKVPHKVVEVKPQRLLEQRVFEQEKKNKAYQLIMSDSDKEDVAARPPTKKVVSEDFI